MTNLKAADLDKRITHKGELYDENDKFREPERDSTVWEDTEKKSVEPMPTVELEPTSTKPEGPDSGVTDMAVEGGQ